MKAIWCQWPPPKSGDQALSNRVRIAVWHNLPSGGGKRALHYHVRGLLARGHTVESWCPPTADQSYLPLSEIVEEHVLPLEFAEPAWRARLPYNIARQWQRRVRLAAIDRHCRRCADQINDGRFDLLYVHPCRFFRTSPIGRFVGLPSILYLQEPFRWLYEALPVLPWAARPTPGSAWERLAGMPAAGSELIGVHADRLQVREELNNAAAFDEILVNSYYSRESVLRAYGLDATVCYLGIDTDLFVMPVENRPRHGVVSLGSMTPEKNVQFILRALANLPAPRPPLLWIANAANYQYLDSMKALATSLDVPFEVRVNLTDHQLIDALSSAAVMAYAPRLEPFGFAPLEANACGLPVVAVREGGVRETVQDGVNGLLVDYDAAAMATAIAELLAQPERARVLGSRGRAEVVKHWSLDASIGRLERCLDRARADRAGR